MMSQLGIGLGEKREKFRANIRRQYTRQFAKEKRKELMSHCHNRAQLTQLHQMLLHNRIPSLPSFLEELASLVSSQDPVPTQLLGDFLVFVLECSRAIRDDKGRQKQLLDVFAIINCIACQLPETAQHSRSILELATYCILGPCRSAILLMLATLSSIEHPQSIRLFHEETFIGRVLEGLYKQLLTDKEKRNALGMFWNLLLCPFSDAKQLSRHISLIHMIISANSNVKIQRYAIQIVKLLLRKNFVIVYQLEFVHILEEFLEFGINQKELLVEITQLLEGVVCKEAPELVVQLLEDQLVDFIQIALHEENKEHQVRLRQILIDVVQVVNELKQVGEYAFRLEGVIKLVVKSYVEYGMQVREETLLLISHWGVSRAASYGEFQELLQNFDPDQESLVCKKHMVDIIEQHLHENARDNQFDHIFQRILMGNINGQSQQLAWRSQMVLEKICPTP